MKIGYACKLIGVENTNMKSCILKNANPDNLIEIIQHNIRALDQIINYNIENNIKLFRISSDIIPFGSNEVNKIGWWNIFSEELKSIGDKIKDNNMRVSLHPGQYTVLNSYKELVVQRSIEELIYHARVLDSLEVDHKHKLVLHIGGAYDDKQLAIKRFKENYKLLPIEVKNRLVIENDDKIYNIEEVLSIGTELGIPVIFDNLHDLINPSNGDYSQIYWIEKCNETWKEKDGYQKIHYSQQAEGKRKGSHSDFIAIDEFMEYVNLINRDDIDIMLEVKDKNLSCIKCVNVTNRKLHINILEKEWSKYKYSILERSHSTYLNIRELLKDKKDFSAMEFYRLIEYALEQSGNIESHINAALHIWGYFKDNVTEKEKIRFFNLIEDHKSSKIEIKQIKNFLKKLVEEYNQEHLLKSLYFYI